MISLIYWIITIILSLLLESWMCLIIMLSLWVIWMFVRYMAKNGVGTDVGDSWWFFDDFDSGSSDDDTSDFDFGDGDFGGGGDGGDW